MNYSDINLVEREEDIFDLSAELVDERLGKLSPEYSAENFFVNIDGRFSVKTRSGGSRPATTGYDFDRLSGDLVWFDRSWIASGTGIQRYRYNGRESTINWSIDYDQTDDSITWIFGRFKLSIPSVSSNSSVQIRMSIPEKKVLVVVRSSIVIPNSGWAYAELQRGSYISFS